MPDVGIMGGALNVAVVSRLAITVAPQVSSVRRFWLRLLVLLFRFGVFGVLSVSGSSVPLGAEPISISRRSPTALFASMYSDR